MPATLRVLVWPAAAAAVLLVLLFALIAPAYATAHSVQPTTIGADATTPPPAATASPGTGGPCC